MSFSYEHVDVIGPRDRDSDRAPGLGGIGPRDRDRDRARLVHVHLWKPRPLGPPMSPCPSSCLEKWIRCSFGPILDPFNVHLWGINLGTPFPDYSKNGHL